MTTYDRQSLLKGLKIGDLVYYRIRGSSPDDAWEWGDPDPPGPARGAVLVDRRRHGLIVDLDLETAMGFQMVKVLWNDSTEIDTIAENYLHKVSENVNDF